jgi:hypothetical protein
MPNPYLDHATAAADVLTTRWFTVSTPGEWDPMTEYWKVPTICAELATFMSLAGCTDHLDILDAAVQAGTGALTDSVFLDDATTWGHLGVVAYDWLQAIGNSEAGSYLQVAVTVGDDLTTQWDDTCGGGLYWMRDPTATGNFKASNATLGLMDIALGLHLAQDTSEDWVAWAKKAWAWIEAKGFVDSHGLVWGGLTGQCTIDQGNVPVIALQGNPLTPLWNMYRVTEDASFLDAAERIADGALEKFSWPGTSIFATPFDGEWAGEDDDWRKSHTNDAMFKGVFSGFFGQLTAALATVPERAEKASHYAAALRANADALVANYPAGVYGMDWHTESPSYSGDPDDTLNACLQFSGLAVLDAAARVS